MSTHSNRGENTSPPSSPCSRCNEPKPTPNAPSTPLEVRLPARRTTVQKLGHRMAEIFFPDDPLHKFKDQTPFNKFVLGIQYFFPIFQWAPHYNLKLLKSDVVAGITIASLSIPQVHWRIFWFLNFG